MLMIHSAMAATTGAGFGDGYAAFEAYVNSIATTTAGWSQNLGDFASNRVRSFKTVATGTLSGFYTGLYGSPWGARFAMNAGIIARVVQHGLFSEAIFNDQIANARVVFVRTSSAGTADLQSVFRNGFQSEPSGGPDDLATWCEEILYFANGQAWRMTPRTSGGPTLFTVP